MIFKETTNDPVTGIKGNCDADLVLWTARHSYEETFDKVILVSSDGDYTSLVKFLQEKNKMGIILSPSNSCSIFLKRTGVPIVYLDEVKPHINKKAPATAKP